ncbi:MAG TPA: hypothetical protein VLJ61_18820, partial [Pyrinomonadaceae bacterium]|nr:hypothetical protein [Pyrinomonadaceae bacterium]
MKPKAPSSLVKLFVSASLAASTLVGGAAVTIHVGAQAQREATQQYPVLSRYASDLTRLARLGRLDAAGREADARKAVEILARGAKNNPVLLAESGADASTVARGVAIELASTQAPEALRG